MRGAARCAAEDGAGARQNVWRDGARFLAIEIDIGQTARAWPEHDADIHLRAIEVLRRVVGVDDAQLPAFAGAWFFSPVIDRDRVLAPADVIERNGER
jgi:hypothetical protein